MKGAMDTMDIVQGRGGAAATAGVDFAFDHDQALAAGSRIDSIAQTIQALPQQAGAQAGISDLGSDRVSQAVAAVLNAQNEVIKAGSSLLSGKIGKTAEKFAAAAEQIQRNEGASAHSLSMNPTTGA